MEREQIFHILGISECTDAQSLKMAYLRKLKDTNPEDDPEGFKQLRQAYEEGQELLKHEDDKSQPETEYDAWIKKADQIYQDFRTRGDVSAWKQILHDPICQDLDRSLEAREAMLGYLLEHFYLPRPVWQCLDEEFEFAKDAQELREQYPAGFIDYICHYLEEEYFIDFSKMHFREGKESEPLNVDGYIRAYLDARSAFDEQQFEKMQQKLEALSAFCVYYFWEDVEWIRLYLEQIKTADEETKQQLLQKADAFVNKIMETEPDSVYALAESGKVRWEQGNYKQAYEYWKNAGDHPEAYMGMIKYYLEITHQPLEAKELAMSILEKDGSNQEAFAYMKQANEELIAQYAQDAQVADGPEERAHIQIESAWCCYQNGKQEEAARLLEASAPGSEDSYSYII